MISPPLTSMVCPVIKDAVGEARKSAVPRISSGVPQRLRGILSLAFLWAVADRLCDHSFSIRPGAIQLTRIRGANSVARQRVRDIMAPLLIAYIWLGNPGAPSRARSQPVVKIHPPSRI